MSFEDARNALVVAYADDSLDDEEFFILYDFYESVNPLYKYLNFDLFCFDSFECLYVQQLNKVSKILPLERSFKILRIKERFWNKN